MPQIGEIRLADGKGKQIQRLKERIKQLEGELSHARLYSEGRIPLQSSGD